MKITWLGQAGLLFECGGKKIIIDPYLSDSVAKVNPANRRRIPVNEEFLKIKPDIIMITHNHLDHLDPETLPNYIGSDTSVTVFAPDGSWQEMRKYGGKNNYILFNPGTEWTDGEIRFYAVKAEHSDPGAIGIILSCEGRNYYVTGDTLYNKAVFDSLPPLDIYAVFLPVNGVGNNMNMADASRFASKVHARYAVPFHIGLFDNLTADNFTYPGRIIPEIWNTIKFPY